MASDVDVICETVETDTVDKSTCIKTEKDEPRVDLIQTDKVKRLRFYCTLAAAMMLYKGSEMMYKTTINSYLFHTIFTVKSMANSSSYYNVSGIGGSDRPGTVTPTGDLSQEQADKFQTFLTAFASTLSLLSLIVYGVLSDYLGRKFVLILVVCGYTLQTLIAFIITTVHLDIAYLTVAYGVDGLSGSAFGFSLGCFICIADVTSDKKERALGIALVESLNGIGRITTEYSTKYFIEAVGHEFPILTSSFGCVSALVVVILFIPETLDSAKTQKTERCQLLKRCRRLPNVKQLFRNLHAFYFDGKAYPGMLLQFRLCFIIFLLVESPIIFRTELVTLIQVQSPFCWTTQMIGAYKAVEIGLNYVVGLLLLKPFQHCLSDSMIATLGIFSAMAYNVATGLAENVMTMYIGALAGTLMLIPKPVVRGFASKMAGPGRQGAVFAGLVAAELICEVVSEVVYYLCYAHAHAVVKGTVFLLIAGVLIIACPLVVLLERLSTLGSRPTSPVNINSTVQRFDKTDD